MYDPSLNERWLKRMNKSRINNISTLLRIFYTVVLRSDTCENFVYF